MRARTTWGTQLQGAMLGSRPLGDPNRKGSPLRETYRFCEGFRMPAHGEGEAGTGAGVRKPPGKEPASHWARARLSLAALARSELRSGSTISDGRVGGSSA